MCIIRSCGFSRWSRCVAVGDAECDVARITLLDCISSCPLATILTFSKQIHCAVSSTPTAPIGRWFRSILRKTSSESKGPSTLQKCSRNGNLHATCLTHHCLTAVSACIFAWRSRPGTSWAFWTSMTAGRWLHSISRTIISA